MSNIPLALVMAACLFFQTLPASADGTPCLVTANGPVFADHQQVNVAPAFSSAAALQTGEVPGGSEKWLWLLLAFPSSAVSALFQWREQWLPQTHNMQADTFQLLHASWSTFIARPSFSTFGRVPHYLNHLTTELVRADAEYWSKLLLFVISVQFIAILWLRGRRRRRNDVY